MSSRRAQQQALVPAAARRALHPVRALADQALSRAAGAPLIEGNSVRLLKDAAENYPAWLKAIASARRHVHFESYIIHDDEVGEQFAEALIAKAREGVPVRLIYDWLGGLGKASRRFWNRLSEAGVEVRCYNPLRFDSPFGWLSRDHRKMVAVDGEVGFVSGLCIGKMWAGDPAKGIEPWRDTGVEIRGPAVADIERAFANVWELIGPPLPEPLVSLEAPRPAGEMNVRVVASVPSTAGMLRLDQLIAALARKRIWLTDAYYAGTAIYAQALRAAALEGVDVRLLLPGATDIPVLRPLSRSGYRPLLEAGVRIFEWNGPMLHAKTAVVDGHWARVGSTNLNVASWLNNCELDVVVENEGFARELEAQYLLDLENATEIVLAKRRVRPCAPRPRRHAARARAHPAAAGAARLSHSLGAAFTTRRELGQVEPRPTLGAALALLALAALFVLFPLLLVVPVVLVQVWIALSLLVRVVRQRWARREPKPLPECEEER
ncbi:MAG: phospholipase D-like domain-containing protein [Myxococcales bacterium]|jgi:cardiolipin synthase